ncbi:unnamed protein product, partial [Polarella glacialis]
RAPHPSARLFTADGGAGGVLRDAAGDEWLAIFGGLRGEGFRDNETWLLGPLGPAGEAKSWQWKEVQSDPRSAQSRERPAPRFHHTQTVIGGSVLVVLGGHNHLVQPILGVGMLQLESEYPQGIGSEEDLSGLAWLSMPDRGAGVSSPAHRAYHSAVEWNEQLILFGGERHLFQHRDTWLLDPRREVWTKLPVDFPEGRSHAAVAIANGDKLVICGGSFHAAAGHVSRASEASRQLKHDVWVLDLLDPAAAGWVCLQPSLPRRCSAPSALPQALHAGRTLIVFGGHDGSDLDHFDDPRSGFLGLSATWVARLSSDGRSIAKARLCSTGLVRPRLGTARVTFSTLTAFGELGVAVACNVDPQYAQYMTATTLSFAGLDGTSAASAAELQSPSPEEGVGGIVNDENEDVGSDDEQWVWEGEESEGAAPSNSSDEQQEEQEEQEEQGEEEEQEEQDEEVEPPQLFSAGSRVRLTGLAGRADLNGRTGTLTGFMHASGRWAVRLAGSGSPSSSPSSSILVRPENLLLVQGSDNQR